MDQEEALRDFSAGDVRRVTGLSSRQLSDWDERGALPHSRAGEAGWRRFSPREVFALMVCAELRKRFGIPVRRVKFVLDFMLQDGADHLSAAVSLISLLGVNVWLLTDFETTFIMDSELEFQDIVEGGLLSGEGEAGFVLLKLTPVVNRLLTRLDRPDALTLHGRGHELIRELRRSMSAEGPAERELLAALRSGDYVSVEVAMKDGKVETIKKTRRVDPTRRISELLGENDFQRITLLRQNGKVVMVEQSITEKP